MSRVSGQLRNREEVARIRRNANRFTRSTRNAGKGGIQPGSIRDVAGKLKITTWEARQHIKDLSSLSIPKKRGRPRLISAEEEAGLVAYVVWLKRSGFPAEKSQVEEAARELRLSRGLSDDLPGKGWHPRFRQRHEELKKSKVKPVEKARKSFENHDIEDVKTFFSSLKEAHEEFDIGPSESWNEDECGIRVGCLGDQVEVLIVRTTRSQRPVLNAPKSTTLIIEKLALFWVPETPSVIVFHRG